MRLEVGVVEVFVQLFSEGYGGVLELGNLDSSVVLELAGYSEVLNNIVGLLGEFAVDSHGSVRVRLGHLKKVA